MDNFAEQLSPQAFHEVSALVREVCDRWYDPIAWRSHLLNGACKLLQGNVGSMMAANLPIEGRLGSSQPLAMVGLSPQIKAALFDKAVALAADSTYDGLEASGFAGYAGLFQVFERDGSATSARADLTSDAAHYASAYHTLFRQPSGCDDYVISVRWVDVPSRVEVVTIDRPPGSARFGTSDVQLLKVLHDEVATLIGVRLATEAHLNTSDLSRRLRETLELLLEGLSETDIASKLGLHHSTVHEYVGKLYRHFDVESRRELMAYFIKRTPLPRP